MARFLWDWDIVPCGNDCWIELILVDINPDLDLTNNICNRTTCSLVVFYSRCSKICCWYMTFMMWFGLYIVPVVPSKFDKLVLLISLPKSQNNHQLLTLFIDRKHMFHLIKKMISIYEVVNVVTWVSFDIHCKLKMAGGEGNFHTFYSCIF